MIGRFRVVLLSLLVCFLVVIARLFYWQVVMAESLKAIGAAQYGRIIEVVPERGEIKTSDGFPIAANKISYTVFANPKLVRDKKETSFVLAKLLGENVASISSELSLDRFWVPLGQNATSGKKDEIEKLNLQGIGFEKNYTRFYPEASMAAALLGIVGKDKDGKNLGYFGLEGFYNRLLRGKEGNATLVQDATGRPILAQTSDVKELRGDNLILSINRSIQFIAEEKLRQAVEKYGASGGTVGIINPTTGEVLAMASYPSFDPSTFAEEDPRLFVNPFISSLYEPGSTFKPLIMSSGLEDKVVEPLTRCDACGGPVSVGGYSLHTWNDQYFANITMNDVIVHSDNTGMVFVSKKLGLDRMIYYLSSFGIGRQTGIDLQGEVSGTLKDKNQWYAVDVATTAFGQGISITPIQLLQAFQAIANKGAIMQPHIVSAIENKDGKKADISPKLIGKPISEKTAKIMTEMLVNAVNNGEAKWARLKGYRIAGKTGTASIPVAGHYDPTKTIASFIGFAPADDPKFLMLVIIDRPTTSIYGAETAAPVFFDISRDLLTYYGISPTE